MPIVNKFVLINLFITGINFRVGNPMANARVDKLKILADFGEFLKDSKL